MSWDNVIAAARRGKGPLWFARRLWRSLLRFRLPVIRPIAALFYMERDLRHRFFPLAAKILYREPLLRYRASRVGIGLNLEGSLPLVVGQGRIEIGDAVTIGGNNTWIVGFKVSTDARLVVGDDVHIGDRVVLSVAKELIIGTSTMISGRVQIYDNVSHPLSPARRLRHESFTLEECAPVHIGSNCWIGNAAIILKGVSIGENSVVGAAAVVTKDVPPNCFVAGNPARVVRSLSDG